MSKNDNEFELPTDPKIIKKIKDAIQEGSAVLQMVDDRKAQLKDISDAMHEEFQIPKKLFNKMVKTFHKNDYNNIVQEDTTFQYLYENIIGE